MIKVKVDEAAYSKVAKGLVRRVVRSLIRQLADQGVLDLTQDLDENTLNLIYTTAFDVLVQFEDFQGHTVGAYRHPVVVGFMSEPVDTPVSQASAEEILTSPKRTDLHGGIEDDLIREVYEELR